MKLGSLKLRDDTWHIDCEPHVAMYLKRFFTRTTDHGGRIMLGNSPNVCFDLKWFLMRFELEVDPLEALEAGAAQHQERVLTLDKITGQKHQPRAFKLAVPARDYQRLAAEHWLTSRGLLLADDVGLGKTCSAIAGLTDPATRPAVVVTLAHLPKQWKREINRFAPDLDVHIIAKGTPYELPKFMGQAPDVLICSYHKLNGWCDVFAKFAKSIIYDEVQELRRPESRKSWAARELAQRIPYRLGLSATPIYNFGGEIYNVLSALTPDALGSAIEFQREWCLSFGDKASLKNPDAFGSYLREQHLMLRRTRKDVGRELPAMQRVTVPVESDESKLKEIEGRAGELARLLLSERETHRGEKMKAAEEFNNLLRQMTGIAKAPFVAEFVRMLVQGGTPVVLYGWHRAVYDIWIEKLKDLQPALYTGSESVTAKQASADRFITGETNLLILSLRSGAGLDGLQQRCSTCVFGELDWSPGVHEQCIGRIYRDGQPDPVAAYFTLSDSGADPMMAETLGLKRDQIDGLRGERPDVLQRNDSDSAIRKLAQQYLKKVKA